MGARWEGASGSKGRRDRAACVQGLGSPKASMLLVTNVYCPTSRVACLPPRALRMSEPGSLTSPSTKGNPGRRFHREQLALNLEVESGQATDQLFSGHEMLEMFEMVEKTEMAEERVPQIGDSNSGTPREKTKKGKCRVSCNKEGPALGNGGR